MSPNRASAPGYLASRLFEGVGDRVTELRHGGNEEDRNQADEQAIFDCGSAIFFSPSFKGEDSCLLLFHSPVLISHAIDSDHESGKLCFEGGLPIPQWSQGYRDLLKSAGISIEILSDFRTCVTP